MPTTEEIKKIAREVANKIEPKKGFGGESYWIRTATEIIEKIVEDYCIVPKSKVKEIYKESKLRSESLLKFDILTGNSRVSLIESLFNVDDL